MLNPFIRPLAAGLAITALAVLAAAATAQAPRTAPLMLEPRGAWSARLGYFPIRVALSTEKPAGVTKEPVYRSAPKYATTRVGNGPRAAYVIAVDEPEGGDWRIYFDRNGNGDLTDDGDGAWKNKRVSPGRTMYGTNSYIVRASWGSPQAETASGFYGLSFYRFTGQDYLLMYREAARVGSVTLNGQRHRALLVENDADAVYGGKRIELDAAGKPKGAPKGNPVWLMIDLNNDGKFAGTAATGPEQFDARAPFTVAGRNYEAIATADGAKITLVPTRKTAMAAPVRPERPPLLTAGTVAPDFVAEAWGTGAPLKLSDYKGKVVILDFWATWCGPCQKSMPHIEKIYQSVKNQNVVVLGVCVWDEKEAYQKWVPANADKYTFTFAYDPAGRDSAKSIAGSLYKVSGIPTTYVIGKDGKVVDAIVGFSDGDTRLEATLKKVGIAVGGSAVAAR